MTYELHLPPRRPDRNAVTGRYMKGHEPFNKGKKWGDYLSKRTMKRCAKGWKNLDKYRHRPPNVGRNKKKVVAIDEAGRWYMYDSISEAAQRFGVAQSNVRRCCVMNSRRNANKRTGAVNSDHKYMGFRFYYESDNIWTTKVKTT